MPEQFTKDVGGTIAAGRSAWRKTLERIQCSELGLCPSFPDIANRWNAWWRFGADAPLILAQFDKPAEIRRDKCFELLDQPEEWVRVRRKQVEETEFFGEALPFVRVDIGPVAMAAFLGAPLRFAIAEQTSWQTPVIEAWENAGPLRVDPNNAWLHKVLRLTEVLAADAHGDYLVCLPDLTGAIDAIANMRGTEQLCFDLYEHRDDVRKASFQAVDAWEKVFTRLYDLILGSGTGITQWVSCWADVPFTVPTCDFSALIGRNDFDDVCMPSLREQARRAGLCVFHLDGPDAARHAGTLAMDPDITAVQYTPGAGTPSALAKLPMFRMLQDHKVPLFISCPIEEVRALAAELDPRGCAIQVSGLQTREQAGDLIRWRDNTFARQ